METNDSLRGYKEKGIVVMWYGAKNDIPIGWSLCDGKIHNGLQTPELIGRVPIGAGHNIMIGEKGHSSDTAGYALGDVGGAAKVVLSTDEMPKHSHGVVGGVTCSGTGCSKKCNIINTKEKVVIEKTVSSGSGLPHDNLPPYIAVYFIIRTS